MPAPTIMKILNTFRAIKNRNFFLPRCPIIINILLLKWKKHIYSISISILCSQLLVILSTKEPLHPSPHSLHDIQFSETDVLAIITTLDINKACGFDNFNPTMFQHCASSLLQIISRLFSTNVSSSTIISEDWRIHCIVPVYKSVDKSSVCNYSPISLLCILSKVLERIPYGGFFLRGIKMCEFCDCIFICKISY